MSGEAERDMADLRALLFLLFRLGVTRVQSELTPDTIRVSWVWRDASWCLDATRQGVVCWRDDDWLIGSPVRPDFTRDHDFWTGVGWEPDAGAEVERWREALRAVVPPRVANESRMVLVLEAGLWLQRKRELAQARATILRVEQDQAMIDTLREP